MVDAPPPVMRKSVPKIVPVGILHPVGVQLAEHVLKSPAGRVTVSLTRVDVEIRIVDAAIGMVNIDWLRRYVQIAEPNGRFCRIEVFGEIAAYAVKPFQLENVSVSTDSEPLRDIGVHDRHATGHGLHNSDVFAVRP